MGETTCNPDTLTIESCDCSTSVSCEESSRSLCRCAALDAQRMSDAIGLTACTDTTQCVCQEFVPLEDAATVVEISKYEGAHTLDGSCQEFSGASIMPHTGFTSQDSLARMSCRLMWSDNTSGGRDLLGCCLVPDDELVTPGDAADPPSIRGTSGARGDDRIEFSVSTADEPLHQIAINASAPSPIIFASTLQGTTITALPQSNTEAHVSTSPGTGYSIEWRWTLPDTLATQDTLSCQLSRFDVSANALNQEHTFGPNRTTPPTEQLGTCTLTP